MGSRKDRLRVTSPSPPSWPGVQGVGVGNSSSDVQSPWPGAGWSGLSGPALWGCLPPGGRPALGSSSDSDMDTSVWLTVGSGTGLAFSSQRPAKLPLSRRGDPAREAGSGQEKRRELRLRVLEPETSPGPGCTWLCQDPWEHKRTLSWAPQWTCHLGASGAQGSGGGADRCWQQQYYLPASLTGGQARPEAE